MAAPSFKYIRPDEMFTYGAAVSGPANADYQPSWLCDGRSGRPVLALNGSPTWTITATAKDVNFVAAINTNIDDGRSITIGDDISVVLTASTRADGISFHPWSPVTETSVSSLTVDISSNTVPVIFGEFVAGFARELGRPIRPGGHRKQEPRVIQPNRWSSIPGYDVQQDRWHFTGDTVLKQSQMDELEEWWFSTHRGTRPSLIVPTPTIQDCLLVAFDGFEYTKQGPNEFNVTLNFTEQARTKWV
jgi:hypothetical protein